MAPFLGLPAELIASIFEHLDNEAFFATRLASKYVESSASTLFSRRFFRKKGYMITTRSLDILDAIASHKAFSKHVQHVWFTPDCYTFVVPKCAPEDDLDCDDAEDEYDSNRIAITKRVDLLSESDKRKWEAYCLCMADHTEYMWPDSTHRPGQLISRLTETFQKLPNLKIVGMRRSEDHSPWGCATLTQEIGEDPRIINFPPAGPVNELSGPTTLFIAMMHAAAESGIELKRLYTDALEIDSIPGYILPQATYDKALGSILYLEINTTKGDHSPYSGPHLQSADRHEELHGSGLLKVMRAAAPTLLELGLQIFPDRMSREAQFGGQGSKKFYQSSAFRKVVENVQFRHLTRLKLEKIFTPGDMLEKFLTPSISHLTSLKMRDIRLMTKPRSESTGRQRLWEPIFTFLHASGTNLSYLLFHRLQYVYGGVTFVPPPHGESDPRSDEHDFVVTEEPFPSGSFNLYEDITLEAEGREVVQSKLARVTEEHWYVGNVFTYAMDDEHWHTDTSDEEW